MNHRRCNSCGHLGSCGQRNCKKCDSSDTWPIVMPGQVWVRDKLVRIVWEVGEDNGRRFIRWTRPGWSTKTGGGTRVWADEFARWCDKAEHVATIAEHSTAFDAAEFFAQRGQR